MTISKEDEAGNAAIVQETLQLEGHKQELHVS